MIACSNALGNLMLPSLTLDCSSPQSFRVFSTEKLRCQPVLRRRSVQVNMIRGRPRYRVYLVSGSGSNGAGAEDYLKCVIALAPIHSNEKSTSPKEGDCPR